ncbi:MAG: hypothetical protein C3F19_03565 [Rhodocyclales bacterium]|nr:MAG: hypothetical protein C3F19_03565 [Rhodocyclales bacterium]
MICTYRRAEEADREAIYRLYRLVMRGLISRIWGWEEQWQLDDFASHFDPHSISLACQGRTLAGYSQVEHRDGLLFIRMMVVHPGFRRNGIGRKLLGDAIASADMQSESIGLEVFKINNKAKAFYESHGFMIEGDTTSSYIMVRA